MKEIIHYNDRVSLMTSNELTAELHHMLQLASVDSDHQLSSNYKNINLNDSLFYNIVLLDSDPVMFFYLQQKDWMPSNVARAYTRFYKDKKVREREYHMIFAPWMDSIMDYHQRSKWLDAYGIDTLFFTRNADRKNDAVRYWARHGWHHYPHMCIINDTVQHVMWKGDTDVEFLNPLVVAQDK